MAAISCLGLTPVHPLWEPSPSSTHSCVEQVAVMPKCLCSARFTCPGYLQLSQVWLGGLQPADSCPSPKEAGSVGLGFGPEAKFR